VPEITADSPDFARSNPSSTAQIARRRPSSGPADLPCEFPVRIWSGRPLFPLLFRAGAPLLSGLWQVRPWPWTFLAKLANMAGTWASGPADSDLGQLTLCTKNYCKLYFVSRNFRKMTNLVKCIGNYLLVGKFRMTYQNAQKNILYMFMSIFMHYKQL
jgi:hypothetical protein